MNAPDGTANAGGTAYPPEPWDLRGHGYVSLWWVPTRVLPALPPGVRALSLFGRSVVATAFVDYLPGGLLPYRELLVAPLARHGRGLGVSITDIWVDSAASRAGGRALWGIPKELAEFDLAHEPVVRAAARAGGATLAEARGRRRRRGLRLPLPMRGRTLQELDGRLADTPLRATGAVHPATVAWRLDGPLAWLRPYRPFLSVAAVDFSLRFGPKRR